MRRADRDDRGEIATTLASAFAGDPLFAWLVRAQGDELERRLVPFFGALAQVSLRRDDHMVFVGGGGAGAAVWRPVGKWKVETLDLLRALPGILTTMRTRLPAMVGALSVIEKAHPTEPHYYLEILGTRRGRQSTGVGSAVIRAGLDRADAEGLPAYLESSNPRNLSFYARHGFEPTEELTVGKGAPVVTTMWREPR